MLTVYIVFFTCRFTSRVFYMILCVCVFMSLLYLQYCIFCMYCCQGRNKWWWWWER